MTIEQADIAPSPSTLLSAVTAEQATFTHDDLVGMAATMLPSDGDPATLMQEAQDLAAKARSLAVSMEGAATQVTTAQADRDAVTGVPVGERKSAVRYTTGEVLDESRAILRGGSEDLGDSGAAAYLDASRLSGEQAQAAEHLARGCRRVSVMEAAAGTGKTHTLSAVSDAYRAAGWEVFGLAPSGRAAAQLRDEGVAGEATTLHSAVARIEAGNAPWTRDDGRHRVVIVDEAGMASAQHLRSLIDSTRGTTTRLVLVGDSRQLGGGQESRRCFQ
ncbi:AAA family ATPase [Actinomyces faecalis]|uniref:AAA family ATPase n=1 Tax=Actinomyces faecalis TaxID=2722820 RepID=UPI003CC83826